LRTLIHPSVRKKNGTGHLKRCLILAQRLSAREEVFLYLDIPPGELESWKEKFPALCEYPLITEKEALPPSLDRIIWDNRSTTYGEFRDWEERAPIIMIDEGGEARKYASLLIDSLPSLSPLVPNVRADALFGEAKSLPPRKRGKPSLLISFGGEDPAGLTAPAMAVLEGKGRELFSSVAVVQGPLAGNLNPPAGISLIKSPPSLENLFQEYDLVLTSFGLTPFEAERAGCGVALINPSPYHEKLSRREGFFSFGTGKGGIRRWLKNPGLILNLPEKKGREGEGKSVPALLENLNTPLRSSCPLCGEGKNPAVRRFSDRTFYRCRRCGNYYLVNWRGVEEVYDREYFFGRYKAQYGKTYLEDFENIRRNGLERLRNISSLRGPAGEGIPRLVDLGCAFGPFLAAAKERGYDCEGVEINPDGADWIEENLEIPVLRASLDEDRTFGELAQRPFDVVTLWYVIEHLPGQIHLLDNIGRVLSPGGILAFGTPSGRGVSARRNLTEFLKRSPADHFVIYTPAGARKILAPRGFTRIRIKSVGHHPERFGGWVGKKGSFTYNAIMAVSRLFSLGDSLEVYALKK